MSNPEHCRPVDETDDPVVEKVLAVAAAVRRLAARHKPADMGVEQPVERAVRIAGPVRVGVVLEMVGNEVSGLVDAFPLELDQAPVLFLSPLTNRADLQQIDQGQPQLSWRSTPPKLGRHPRARAGSGDRPFVLGGESAASAATIGFLGVLFVCVGNERAVISLWDDAEAVALLDSSTSYRETVARISATNTLAGSSSVELFEVHGGDLSPALSRVNLHLSER
jgi:hypothetical protein